MQNKNMLCQNSVETTEGSSIMKLMTPGLKRLTDKQQKDRMIEKIEKYLDDLDGDATNACQRYAVAFELKFRGQNTDVKTVGSPLHHVFDVPVGGSYPLQNWCMFKHAKFTSINGDPLTSIESTMRKWGDGARAICALTWKSGRGHVFNLVIIKDEIWLADASANRLKLVKDSKYVKDETDGSKSLGLIRTDKGSPDRDMIDATFDDDFKCTITKIKDGTTPKTKFQSIIDALSSQGEKGEIFEIRTTGEIIGKVKCREIVHTYGSEIKVWDYSWV